MFNQLSVVPLYLACQSLMSGNSSNINLSVVIDTPPESPKLAKDLPRGYTVFPDIGSAYKLYKKKLTWSAAQKYCAGEGGYLAVIDSFEKINYTVGLISEAAYISVGIHRLFDENEWVEMKTGLPPAKIPWTEEPQTHDKSRKCTKIESNRSGIYASSCSFAAYFVCEIPI